MVLHVWLIVQVSNMKHLDWRTLETQLVQHVLKLAMIYATPALLVAALVPTLDLLLLNFNLKINWTEFKVGGVVFSLAGFVALGATICNGTFSYANASDANIAQVLRTAARNLYATLFTTLALIVLAFSLNVYSILLDPGAGGTGIALIWYVIALPGVVFTLLCTVLLTVKLSRFIQGVLTALRLEHQKLN